MTEDQAIKLFEKIDVSSSKCYKASERKKLLGIIEQGRYSHLILNHSILQHLLDVKFCKFKF